MTLSGNSRAGFSQCISLPAHVPFQYSGNLCSSREGLADTTQQPVSRRGIEPEKTKERTEKQDERMRQGTCRERCERGLPEFDRCGAVAAIIIDKDPEKVRGGFLSWQGKREKAESTGNQKKG